MQSTLAKRKYEIKKVLDYFGLDLSEDRAITLFFREDEFKSDAYVRLEGTKVMILDHEAIDKWIASDTNLEHVLKILQVRRLLQTEVRSLKESAIITEDRSRAGPVKRGALRALSLG